jgi:excinuclease UvrABC helicase subunit UvrB
MVNNDDVFKLMANTCSTVYVLWDYYRGLFYVDENHYSIYVLCAQFFYTSESAENKKKELIDISSNLSSTLSNLGLQIKELSIMVKG